MDEQIVSNEVERDDDETLPLDKRMWVPPPVFTEQQEQRIRELAKAIALNILDPGFKDWKAQDG